MIQLEENPNYFICEEGRLFSVKKNRYLEGSIKDSGYYHHNINVNGVRKHITTHRLVAKYFIPNPENKYAVNHKDGVKTNNHVSNLEWVTAKENLEHAKNVLGKRIYFQNGVKHHNSKLNKKKVREIRRKYANGGCSNRSLAKEYGVSNLVINFVINNKTWKNV